MVEAEIWRRDRFASRLDNLQVFERRKAKCALLAAAGAAAGLQQGHAQAMHEVPCKGRTKADGAAVFTKPAFLIVVLLSHTV